MKYEVLLFDADETLFDFKKSEKEAFKNAMIEFGVDYDESYHLPIYKEINTAIWKEFEKDLITQAQLKTERFRRLAVKLNMDFNPEEFAAAYMKHLSYASFLYEGSIELVKDLSKKYKLAIITNGLTAVQTRRVRGSVIADYFDEIVISEEVSVSKPHPEIFEYTLKKLNFSDKSKVIMIGDSLTSDIMGGHNFGIDTLWLNQDKKSNTLDISPTYEAHSLEDIRKILL
ncbi:MAG: YjjG family noncanonical pyrimidine nucleotidase [Clostridium sp.]|uniref:YjjG family noncanonical pyrimidine nucleotidase n=1 Tax=Clostridium sp. TaxID=1506 RepID=UPI002FC76058